MYLRVVSGLILYSNEKERECVPNCVCGHCVGGHVEEEEVHLGVVRRLQRHLAGALQHPRGVLRGGHEHDGAVAMLRLHAVVVRGQWLESPRWWSCG